MFLIESLEPGDNFFHRRGVEVGVEFGADLFFDGVEHMLKLGFFDFHDDVGEHRDEPAVAVIGETGISGQGSQAFDDLIVESKVQNGVHHAWHRGPGTGTDGYQVGVFRIAELFADLIFGLGQGCEDLVFDVLGNFLTVIIVTGAGFGCDREAAWDGQPQAGHFRQVGALAAEKVFHLGVAFSELIDILGHGLYSSLSSARICSWQALMHCAGKF